MTRIFVYGTLLRGMQRSPVLENSRFLGFAEIKGKLFDLGHYPGVGEGYDRIVGELFEVESKTLDLLDQIEGYDPLAVEDSLYRRMTCSVTSLNDGAESDAFVYFFNREWHDSDDTRRIESGDYRLEVASRSQGETYYIAYGSNLDPDRLERRIGTCHAVTKGYLKDFELVFNKGNYDGSACANLRCAPGDRVPFVAYHLPGGRDQLKALDSFEGVSDSYYQTSYPFPFGEDQTLTLGHLYVANPARIRADLSPRPDYLNYIREGYLTHGFPEEWIRRLNAAGTGCSDRESTCG
jgi:gamma-glutamylcyclotransferase (GGCT)/AIG2-like uncharacterized protein YtfP